MNLSFRTNMSRQSVQSQGLHCLPLCLPILSLSEFLNMLNGHSAGQVKIVGDKLLLSLSCPSDKLKSLAYF